MKFVKTLKSFLPEILVIKYLKLQSHSDEQLISEIMLYKLENIKHGFFGIETSSGICGNIRIFSLRSTDFFLFTQRYRTKHNELFKKWSKFSGYTNYPVPSPYAEICEGGIYEHTGDKWKGEYGQLRMELVEFMIEELHKELK